MNRTREEKRPRDDNDDLDAGREPEVIPADEDIQEGDEEKDEGQLFPLRCLRGLKSAANVLSWNGIALHFGVFRSRISEDIFYLMTL